MSRQQLPPRPWLGWWQGRAARRSRRDAAHALYAAVVQQARQPVFFAEWGVPDSRDGRLEMVGLHAILVMRRLRDEGRPGQELAQMLFDLLFADLDRHLREWGVGDLSVGKHVKHLAQTFLARAKALDPLLAGTDPSAMREVLARNVYAEVAAPDRGAVDRLGRYLVRQHRSLAGHDGAELLAGRVVFAAADPREPGPDS